MAPVVPAMTRRLTRLSRRTFLADLGRGSAAIAVFGLAACSSSDDERSSDATNPTTAGGVAGPETNQGGDADGVRWTEVSFGFVSAFVLARPDGITVVDTGTSGGVGAIETAIGELGGTWTDVGHVIATHSHGDHVGSLQQVLDAAPNATGYAGTDDLADISIAADLVGLEDGDDVAGFQIVATPGHTPGSICVYDPMSRLLVAGDAVLTSGGDIQGPSAQFSADLDLANASALRLAELQVETLLAGHGDPVVDRTAEKLAALALDLG